MPSRVHGGRPVAAGVHRASRRTGLRRMPSASLRIGMQCTSGSARSGDGPSVTLFPPPGPRPYETVWLSRGVRSDVPVHHPAGVVDDPGAVAGGDSHLLPHARRAGQPVGCQVHRWPPARSRAGRIVQPPVRTRRAPVRAIHDLPEECRDARLRRVVQIARAGGHRDHRPRLPLLGPDRRPGAGARAGDRDPGRDLRSPPAQHHRRLPQPLRDHHQLHAFPIS